jgi:lipopolysaccharide export system protein LptA
VKRIGLLITVFFLLSGALSLAAESGVLKMRGDSKPIEIDSESMELRNQERTVIFIGSVVARRDDLTLQADRVEVKMAEKGQDVETIHAIGNVRVRKGDLLASGRDGLYRVAEDSVLLSGEPKIWRGRDAVTGDTVKVFLTEERVEVEKARAIMFPNANAEGNKP